MLFTLNKKTLLIVSALVVVLVGAAGYYLFANDSTGQTSQQSEVDALVAAVGKLMILPADEQPVVATVADPEKLKDQPFFARAKKGTKVLIYNSARKAILYDPDLKLIIDVAPLNTGVTPTP